MLFTDKQLKERIKQLETKKNDLEIEIYAQELHAKTLTERAEYKELYAWNESNRNNKLEEQVKQLQTRILELEDQSVELEHETELKNKRWEEYLTIRGDRDKVVKELQTAKEVKEKFETENIILKSANKVLSDVNLKVQPIMDENIKLKSQLEYNVTLLSSKDETINDLKSQLVNRDKKIDDLMEVITKFQTKDAQVVQPQVIQPSVIEPTVLSTKK